MNQFTKRFFAIFLAAAVLFTSVPVNTVSAESLDKKQTLAQTAEMNQCEEGVLKPKWIEITPEDWTDPKSEVSMYSAKSSRVASQGYNNAFWDKYSTNYYYNLLSEDEQQLWEQLDAVCLDYLTRQEDIPCMSVGGNVVYCMDMVGSSALSISEMQEIGLLFRVSNPQYYFLNTTILYGVDNSNNENVIALGAYNTFADGQDRSSLTTQVKNKLSAWESQMTGAGSEFEKAKKAQEIVMGAADYNYAALDENGAVTSAADEQYITQSAYSALLLGKTVCAGYSMAYEMLLNSAGVDAISVTSSTHHWNKVRVEDSWYNVDVTWADTSGAKYTYFMKNDAQYGTISDHSPIASWRNYLPSCTLTVSGSGNTIGSLPRAAGTTATPAVSVKKNGSVYTITVSCNTQGAKIYYTLNGTTPSAAYTKSKSYRSSFTVNDYTKVRAVAVRDTYKDSAVATATASNTKSNVTISYQLNGGKNHTNNKTVYTKGSNVQLYNPTKTGYTFAGWYTNSKCSGSKITKITNISKNYTLYAKWTANKYTVSFNKNGLKLKGDFSAKTYSYGKTYTMPKTSTKKKGYDLVWNTKKNGKGTSYKAGAKVNNLTSAKGKKVTLYAKWVKHKYTIKYQLKGGTNNSKNPKSYYVTTKTIKLKSPKRKGYQFVGWYSDKKCKNKVTQIKKGTAKNYTLYAKWKKVK